MVGGLRRYAQEEPVCVFACDCDASEAELCPAANAQSSVCDCASVVRLHNSAVEICLPVPNPLRNPVSSHLHSSGDTLKELNVFENECKMSSRTVVKHVKKVKNRSDSKFWTDSLSLHVC